MIKKQFHQKTRLTLCWLIAFMLPFYIHVVPVLIALLLINWLIEGRFPEKISCLKKYKITGLFISLYLFYLLGMIWTQNTGSGLFDLEVKLSLLLFPITVGSSIFERKNALNTILYAFIYGCCLGATFCFGKAIYQLILTGKDHFTYMEFSWILHPSYFSMYLNFAIIILCYFLFTRSKNLSFINTVCSYSALILFTVTIILAASKIGIITLFLTAITSILFLIIKQKKIILAILMLMALIGIFYSINNLFPYISSRIENATYVFTHPADVKNTDSGSNTDRILVWKAGLNVLKKNFLMGAGTGDVKDALLEEYKTQNMTGVFEKQLNTHNQFLQTFIALGGGGFFILILHFLIPMWFSFKKKYIIYLFFLLIVFMNLLVESMLEVQAGVMFFAFFNSLLFYNSKDQNSACI